MQEIVRPGQTIASRSLKKLLGGKGANQAKAIACAGVNVLLDGAVGGDPEGESVKDKLCEAIEGSEGRILEDRIRLAEGVSTGKAVIQLADDGENCISECAHLGSAWFGTLKSTLTYPPVILGGANTHALPDPNPLIPKGITHLLLANEIILESTITYLEAAHSRSITTIFNPSPMLSTKQLQSFPLDKLDWLIVNQGEMATIYDSLVGKEAQIDPEAEDSPDVVIENAKRLFKKLGNRTNILCTIGGQGVIYVRSTSDSEDEEPKSGHLPAAKLLNPIKDTTGAGDCFMGFFAAGMSRIARSDGFKSESNVSDEEFEGVLKTCLTVSPSSPIR